MFFIVLKLEEFYIDGRLAVMSSTLSPTAASFIPASVAATVQLQQYVKGCQQHWSDIVGHFLVLYHYSPEVALGKSWKYSMGQKSLHAFSYNFTESEPMWIKSGTVWAKRGGRARADYRHYVRSYDSLRGSQNFVIFVR